jgi:DNA-binding transcriptional regulator YiaG
MAARKRARGRRRVPLVTDFNQLRKAAGLTCAQLATAIEESPAMVRRWARQGWAPRWVVDGLADGNLKPLSALEAAGRAQPPPDEFKQLLARARLAAADFARRAGASVVSLRRWARTGRYPAWALELARYYAGYFDDPEFAEFRVAHGQLWYHDRADGLLGVVSPRAGLHAGHLRGYQYSHRLQWETQERNEQLRRENAALKAEIEALRRELAWQPEDEAATMAALAGALAALQSRALRRGAGAARMG